MSAMIETEGRSWDGARDRWGARKRSHWHYKYADAIFYFAWFAKGVPLFMPLGTAWWFIDHDSEYSVWWQLVARETGMNKGSPVRIRHRRATVLYGSSASMPLRKREGGSQILIECRMYITLWLKMLRIVLLNKIYIKLNKWTNKNNNHTVVIFY